MCLQYQVKPEEENSVPVIGAADSNKHVTSPNLACLVIEASMFVLTIDISDCPGFEAMGA